MLSMEITAASAAVKVNQAEVAALLDTFGRAPIWDKAAAAADLSASIFRGLELRNAYADAVEAELAALDDRVRRLEQSAEGTQCQRV